MKLKTNYKPDLCVVPGFFAGEATKAQQKATGYVHLDPEKGMLYATDGKVVVKCKVSASSKDKPGLIPADAFAHARKRAKAANADTIELVVKADVVDVIEEKKVVASFERPVVEEDFPNLEKEFRAAKLKNDALDNRNAYAFDKRNYAKLASAVGGKGVRIEVTEEGQPNVFKRADDAKDIVGLIPKFNPALDNDDGEDDASDGREDGSQRKKEAAGLYEDKE